MTIRDNAARLFHSLENAQDQQLRQRALKNPRTFMRLAAQQGHQINLHNLEAEVARLSTEAIAAIWNPGVGPRRHLIRR